MSDPTTSEIQELQSVPNTTGTRFFATLASMLMLAASAAGPTTAELATTAPATTATASTNAPTTIQVVIATTVPAVEPTTQQVVEAARKGNVYVRAADVFQDSGIRQSIERTRLWQWPAALACIAVGIALGTLLARALRGLGMRSATRVRLWQAVAFNSFAGPLSMFVVIVGFGAAIFAVLKPTASVIGLLIPAFQLAHIVALGWLLYNLVDLVTLVMTRMSRGRQGSLSVMLVPMTRRVLRVVLVTVLLLFAANNVLDWQIGALLAGLGIAGLAVSLAAQDTLRNLFGSVMIFADQPFVMGDLIRVTDFEGRVEDIGFRSTRLRTSDGAVVTIPNGNIAGAAVVNHSRRRAARHAIDLTLATDTPIEKVRDALRTIRETLATPEVAGDLDASHGEPFATLEDPVALRIRVVAWFGSRDERAARDAAERFDLTLIERLRRAGVTFK